LIKFFKDKIVNHFSLIILVLGAVCFLFTNIMLKERLDRKEYGEYSIWITYLSMMYIYGLLGIEQVFVRYSHLIRTNTFETQKIQLNLIFGAMIFTSVTGSLFFYFNYGEVEVNFLVLLVTTFCMVVLLFFFSVFRLNSSFIFAQLIPNIYKFALFALTLFLFFLYEVKWDIIKYGIAISIMGTFLCGLFFYKKNLRFEYVKGHPNNIIFVSAVYFLISTTSFSLVSFADRYIIEHKFGIEKLGDYFYLTNLFLAPFSILQNYVGFRQLITYKSNFSTEVFLKNNRKVLMFGLAISLVLFAGSKIINQLNMVNFNFGEYDFTIVLLLIFGVVKLYNSDINAAFDVRTNIVNLKKANIINLLVAVLILILASLLAQSMEQIIILIILIWILRATVLKSLLLNQEKIQSVE